MIYFVAFDPIKILTYWALQNDSQNLSFVKDKHTFGKKMARNSRTKDIYKGTFICIQTLVGFFEKFDFMQDIRMQRTLPQ